MYFYNELLDGTILHDHHVDAFDRSYLVDDIEYIAERMIDAYCDQIQSIPFVDDIEPF